MASGREGSASPLLQLGKSCDGDNQNNNKRALGAGGAGQLRCSRCQAEISPGTAEDKEVGRDNTTFPARCPPVAGLNLAALAPPRPRLAGRCPAGCAGWKHRASPAWPWHVLGCEGSVGAVREGSQPSAVLRAQGKQSSGCREAGIRERGWCRIHGDSEDQGGG